MLKSQTRSTIELAVRAVELSLANDESDSASAANSVCKAIDYAIGKDLCASLASLCEAWVKASSGFAEQFEPGELDHLLNPEKEVKKDSS
jgi:hypothetical protein